MFTGEATTWEDEMDDDASSLQRLAAISFCPEGVGVQLADDLPGTGSKTFR
jgi:hypothetical protein